MNIIITGKNFNLSEANKAYAEEKMKHLTTYDESILNIRIEIDADKKERNHQKYRVEAWVEGRNNAQAGAHGFSIFEAIDKAAHTLKRQIVKKKERKRTH